MRGMPCVPTGAADKQGLSERHERVDHVARGLRAGVGVGAAPPVVQGRIREALTAAPPGPVRVISICAGDGATSSAPVGASTAG